MPTLFDILVIDDDDMIREIICRLLKKKGYTISSAASLTEARQLFALNGPPALGCIIDKNLDGADGELLAAEFLVAHETLNIIMISGDDIEDMAFVLDDERVVFLPKPFERRQLNAIVAQHLGDPQEN